MEDLEALIKALGAVKAVDYDCVALAPAVDCLEDLIQRANQQAIEDATNDARKRS